MKAAVVGENALEIREVPQPKPKPTEVLVRVRAIGLNRAELPGAYGSGHHRATGSIPGIEWWDPLESTCRHASLSIL